MRVHDSVLDLVGGTPLVRLRRVTGPVGATVVAKLEFLNPGGSVKDRAALHMVAAAERDGTLAPGATIVEPTSGNTGVALALVAQVRGYRCVFTCPDKVALEKRNVLGALGAEVIVCPAAAPPDSPHFYRNVAVARAAEIPGAVVLDQYANPANARAHFETTGPELWEQTEGRLTHFVASVGTGGTISGAGAYLKQVSRGGVRVIGADPAGSVYSGGSGRPWLVEGVGQPTFPDAYDPAIPDAIVPVTDRDSIEMARRLAREEGLLVGGSSGTAVAAAVEVAADLDRRHLVAVVLPDSGRGYLSKLFDDGWLARNGFGPPASSVRVEDALDGARPEELLGCMPSERVTVAFARMRAHGTACLPVFRAEPPVRIAEVVGTLRERELARGLAAGTLGEHDLVSSAMTAPLPAVGAQQALDEAVAVVLEHDAVLVLDGGTVRGVLRAGDVAASFVSTPWAYRAVGGAG